MPPNLESMQHYLNQARDREQEAEGLLHRAIKLQEEAAQLRAKAHAIVRELAEASERDSRIDELE